MKTIKTISRVKMETVSNLLCSAFEGGSNYWYQITDFKEPSRFDFRSHEDQIFKHLDYPMNSNGSLTITTLEGDEFKGVKEWTLDLAAIRKGLQIMADKYPHHFRDAMAENDDAITGDVFLQCCLFDEIVYG
jgi:hypothetical protein